MLFTRWVEFDEEGEIKNLYTNREECKGECTEFLIKLIPIDRHCDIESELEDFENSIDVLTRQAMRNLKESAKYKTELQKAVRELRRI